MSVCYVNFVCILQSDIMKGAISEKVSKPLREEVFPIMWYDDVGTLAREDPTIVSLGNMWMQRNIGNKLMRKHYTSAVMRLYVNDHCDLIMRL